jgi:lysyl-tRNA synthetase class 2
VVVAKGLNNRGESEELLRLLRQEEQKAVQDSSLQDIKNHPRIASWRQAYQRFGSNPNKFYPSVESLCRRARRGDQLPYINTAVAIFNYFSLKHVVPSGADDIASAAGDLRLTIAKGDEPFTPFNSTTIEYPDPGEVIYFDGGAVMCRRWNWRQGDQTKLTPETTDIVINVDCLPPVTPEQARALTVELADLVRQLCGGDVRTELLSKDRNEVET